MNESAVSEHDQQWWCPGLHHDNEKDQHSSRNYFLITTMYVLI